jgi:hypothetical protein
MATATASVINLKTAKALGLTVAGSYSQPKDTASQFAGLVALRRSESVDDHLGGRAMLKAPLTTMFARAKP